MPEKTIVHNFSSWDGLAIHAAKELLEEAFGKKLNSGYFSEKPLSLFIEKDWKGLAVVKDANGLCYLDKLAVKKEFQNNGVATQLLNAIFEKHPKVFWRTSANNPANLYYFKNCTGCMKDKDWTVFWKNLGTEEIDKAVFFALKRKPDFE
ncbi:MAG: GNAT family N-acetyltransferase [Candidatus Diapherotrites archaeon]|uniref:GNAT family N-acetyltransferase n=1 Tax=Candidatus Iainarchaeum sp. TaxID=3101447 RepID=A0A939C678_9ARCH|nr:GNAT family N-acetyltransferase [Candidatus Diapherotrites archaeon]